MANILVIDDEEEMRDLLNMMLTDDHHKVTMAGDGEQGMRFCGRQKFDLIITDIVMPNKDGIDFIVELENAGNKTPIIAMSGGVRKLLTSEFNLGAAVSIGVKETLKKPFTKLELRHAIKNVLNLPDHEDN